MTSLNPAYTIGSQMTEVLRRHRGLSRGQARERAAAMLARVGMNRARPQARAIPAPALRGASPAGDDRHGADLRARASDRRRADHRARCHGAGAGAPPARRDQARARARDAADHARSGHGRARRRPRLRDVCGRDRGIRARGLAFRSPHAPLHEGAARRRAGAGEGAARGAARRDPGQRAASCAGLRRLRLPRPLRRGDPRLRRSHRPPGDRRGS